jgi:hypothetical protein
MTMRSNQTRQATPRGRLRVERTPLTRRACAFRSTFSRLRSAQGSAEFSRPNQRDRATTRDRGQGLLLCELGAFAGVQGGQFERPVGCIAEYRVRMELPGASRKGTPSPQRIPWRIAWGLAGFGCLGRSARPGFLSGAIVLAVEGDRRMSRAGHCT